MAARRGGAARCGRARRSFGLTLRLAGCVVLRLDRARRVACDVLHLGEPLLEDFRNAHDVRADIGHVLDVRALHLGSTRGGGVLQDDDVVVQGKRVIAGRAHAVRSRGAREHHGAYALAREHVVKLRVEERREARLYHYTVAVRGR